MFCSCVFFKQKTAYEMRISYWSSDVCSSDLCPAAEHGSSYLSPSRQSWKAAWIKAAALFGLFGRAIVAELAVARIERAGDVLAKGIVIFLDLRDKYRLGLDFGSGTHARADAHNLHLSMDGALVHLLKRRRHLRQALGHGEHLGFEAFDRKGAICKPRFHRLDAGEIIAGEHHFHGAPHPHQPREDLIVRRAHHPHWRVADQIGRAHVCTPVTNAHPACRLLS